jgi:hypothetical protein
MVLEPFPWSGRFRRDRPDQDAEERPYDLASLTRTSAISEPSGPHLHGTFGPAAREALFLDQDETEEGVVMAQAGVPPEDRSSRTEEAKASKALATAPGKKPRGAKVALILDTLSAVPLWVATPLVRPWHMRWGATDAEVAAPMPGDEIVDRAQFNATRAITIEAPPEHVWPWIAQLGYGRGGFYTYDLVDNAGERSAD